MTNSPDHTHDPAAASWVEGADGHDQFPVQNLPLGVFSRGEGAPAIGTAIGEQVLDLAALATGGHLPPSLGPALRAPSLNALFALPAQARLDLRHALFAMLTRPEWRDRVAQHLHPAADCRMHLPFSIGDYTDFYTGIHHAAHIGQQFRPDAPLLPNYRHIPIGYHGRASSVQVSGTAVPRPCGQMRAGDAAEPRFGPTARLDYEVELGMWIAGANPLGQPVPIAQAPERIGGYCLLNDWSARDMQAWEYQPLGPFLAKSFLTSVSPWVITQQALAPFGLAQPARAPGDPVPLPYLMDARDQAHGALAITLEATLTTRAMRAAHLPEHRLSRTDAAVMYWTPAQLVAHHTSNGCNLLPGDLLGSGTLSGPTPDSLGCLMEICEGGQTPLRLPGGETRRFLEAGDEITLRARATRPGWRTIGFGACTGRVEGASPQPNA